MALALAVGAVTVVQQGIAPPQVWAASVQGTADTGGWKLINGTTPLQLGGTTAAASAAVPFAPLDDKTLYFSSSRNNGTVGYFTTGGVPPADAAHQTLIGYGKNANLLGGNPLSTIAVDADGYGQRGVKSAYFWAWDSSNGVSAAENGGTAVPAGTVPVIRWTEGSTDGEFLLVPNVTYPAFPSQGNGNRYWSAGEVIQQTGEIFFGGGECTTLGRTYNMMIFDPITFAYNFSGNIEPATPSDNIFDNVGTSSCGGAGYVASDMALDGLGNAYLQVVSNRAAPAFGLAAAQRVWLVRVVPGTDGAPWTYNLVTPLVAAPGQGSMVRNYVDGGTYNYGSAFFQGKLYVTMWQDGGHLLEINPMSGLVSSLPNGASSVPVMGPTENYVLDLASGQTAMTIKGRVFDDANADGAVDPAEAGLPSQHVALYMKDPASGQYVLQGLRTTDGSGNYSFLVGGAGDFVVRLVRPAKGGVNAVQTWASGGGVLNPVTAHCANGDITSAAGGVCVGAIRQPAPDPAPPTDIAALGKDTSIQPDAMPIYTSVTVTTADEVATADFAVTAAGSFGDASVGRTTVADQGPVHVNGPLPRVWLGQALGAYPDGARDDAAHNASDDGVFLATPSGQRIGLEGEVFAATKTYSNVIAQVTTAQGNDQAVVSGWVTTPGAAGADAFGSTPTWTPTGVGADGLLSGAFVPSRATGPVAPTGADTWLRAQVSTTATTAPDNTTSAYQDSATGPWVTDGEIEDYHYRVADAVYRVAARTSGGVANVTVDGQALDTAQHNPQVGAGQLMAVGSRSLAAQIPAGWRLTGVSLTDTDSGAALASPQVTVDGATAHFTIEASLGDDLTVEVGLSRDPDPARSQLTVSGPGGVGPGGAITATATVVSASGDPLPQVVVSWATQSDPVAVSPAQCTTDADGRCQAQVTSEAAGVYDHELSAQVTTAAGPANVSGSPASLTFIATAFDPQHSTLAARPTAGTTPVFAGQSWTVELTAHDSADKPVTGLDVTFTVAPAVTLGPISETAPGVYQASATATTAGTYPVGASAGGVTAAQTPKLVFTAGPGVDPTRSQLTVAPARQTAGAPVQATVVAQDSYGNPIDWLTAADVAIAGTAVKPANNPALAPTPGTFNANGAADGRYTVDLTSQAAGSFAVAATVQGVALAQQPTVTFVAGPACVTNCVVGEPGTSATLTKNGALADGSDQDTAEVRVFDTYGNPVEGATVVATRTGDGLEPASQSVTTGDDGTAQLAWTATTPGTFTAAITVDGLSGFPGAVQNQIKFQSQAVDPAHSTLTITPASPIAAGQSYTATVETRDAQGGLVGGAVVSFTLTPAGFTPAQAAELSAATCTTRDAEPNRGTCQITARATAAGAYDLRATVPGAGGAPVDLTGGTTASPARLAWTAGPVCVPPADSGCSPDPARQSRVEVTTNNQRADGVAQDLATVYAFDRFGNPVAGVAWATSTTDAGLGLPTKDGVTGEDGRASLAYTSFVAGGHQAQALIAGQEALGSPITLSFADVPAGGARLTVAPASQTVGLTIALTAAITNEAGQPSAGLTVAFSASAPSVSFVNGQSTCTTDAQGRCTVQVTSTTAGSAQLAFATPPAPTVDGSPATVVFTPGDVDAALTEVRIVANGALPDGQDRDLVKVVAKDRYGNPIDGVAVTSTTSDAALSVLTPIAATGSAGEPGVTQIGYTSTQGGTHVADILVGGVKPTGGLGSPVTLGFGGQIDPARSSWTLRPKDPALTSPLLVGLTDASLFVATVEARDGLDQPVADAVVTFTADPAGPRWAGDHYSCLTDATGRCSVEVYSTVSGSYSVTAAAAAGVIGQAQPAAWRADAVCGADCTPDPDVPPEKYSRVELTVDGAPADDVTPDVATVYAFDRYGNPVPNQLVTSTAADPRLRVQDGIPATGDGHGGTIPGVARIEYFTRVAGVEFEVTVAVGQPGDLKTPRGLPLRLHFGHDCLPGIDPGCVALPGQPTSHLEVTADGRPADGVTADTVTVALFDRQGTPVAGLPVRSSAPSPVAVADPAETDDSGRSAIDYTTTTAGAYQVTVEVLSQGVWRAVTLAAGASPVPPSWQGSPVQLTFVGGAPCAGEPEPGVPNEARNHVVVGLNNQLAGVGADRATVGLFDCWGNPSPGVVVRSTSDAAVTVGPIAPTDAAGQTAITYTTTPAGYGDHLAAVTFVDPSGVHELAVHPQPGTAWPAEFVGSPISLRFVTDSLTPPVVTSPTAGAKLGDPAPTIAGTGIPGATVTVSDGGTVLVTAEVGPDGHWAVTPPPLGDGSHVLTATQTDQGFTSPPTGPITITISTKKPTTCAAAPDDPDCFDLIKPAEGASVAELLPTFEGVGAAGDQVSVAEDGHVLCAATVGADGAWRCQPGGALPEGAHTVVATVTDEFGNQSDPITRHFGVDVTAPCLAGDADCAFPLVIVRPAEGAEVNVARPDFAGSGEPGTTVTVRQDGATLCQATVAADGSWRCAATVELPDGPHTVTVTAADAAGNVSGELTRHFGVDTTTTTPVVTKPAEGEFVNAAGGFETAGQAEPGSVVTVRDETGATLCHATADAQGVWACAVPPSTGLPEGPHTLQVTSVDRAGNVSDPAERRFTVDNTAPSPAVIDAPKDGSAVNDRQPTVAGHGAEPGATVTVTGGDGNTCAATADASGRFSCRLPQPLPDGPGSVTVVVTDAAGNASDPATSRFTVDTVPPGQPTIDTRDPGRLTGTADPDTHVTVTDKDGQALCQATPDLSGTWSCRPDRPLGPGDRITVSAADAAGNATAITVRLVQLTLAWPTRERGSVQTAVGRYFQPGERIRCAVDGVAVGPTLPGADGGAPLGTTMPAGLVGEAIVGATMPAGVDGQAVCGWTVGADQALGRHVVTMTGDVSGPAVAEFTVTAPLPVTGAPLTRALAAAAVVALGLGLGCLLVAVRRRRDGAAAT